MKVQVERQQWKGIPVLHIFNEKMNEQTPIVIFLHGFMSAKEHNLHYAYNLVERGVRVVLPDAYLHGERDEAMGEAQMNVMFWQIVMTSIGEVGALQAELEERGFTGRVGVAGTSMGAITTTGCLSTYEWIQAASVLMGAISFPQFLKLQFDGMRKTGVALPLTDAQIEEVNALLAPYDGYAHNTLLTQIPVYMWHGAKDATVPISLTEPFLPYLAEQGVSHQITYVKEEKAGHAVSRKGILQCTEFLATHLKQ